jgi:hypothetical protein
MADRAPRCYSSALLRLHHQGLRHRDLLRSGGLALTLILLPIASARRLRNASRGLYGMCLFLAACVAALGLAGCGFKPGAGLGTTAKPDAAQPVTYTLTVVMTTGAQQVTMPETLVVQPQ